VIPRNVVLTALTIAVLISTSLGGGLSTPGVVGQSAPMVRADRGVSLLKHPEVQKELNLSLEQISKVKDLEKELQAAAESFDKKDFGKYFKKVTEVNVRGAKAAAALLKPEQLKRIQQIQLQAVGPQAFFDLDLADKLKLTVQQKQSITDTYNGGRSKALADALKTREGSQEKMKEIQAATMARITKLLTEEQQREYKSMLGEPFTGRLPMIIGAPVKSELKKE